MVLRPAFATALLATFAALLSSCGGSASSDHVSFTFSPPCNSNPCVTTVAGSGEMGNVDGMAMSAQFTFPHALAMDANADLHVADFGNNGLTRVLSGDQVSTLEEDAIEFPQPADSATDSAGNRYVADSYGNRILKITPEGVTTVLAGTGRNGDDDGTAESATFSMPSGLVLGADGALYVADMGNRKIRRISLG